MNAKPANLEQIQRWMQSVIMHPGGVAEGDRIARGAAAPGRAPRRSWRA